jgi:alkylation response protein AidB-like acyl-CoA dehydrogenase
MEGAKTFASGAGHISRAIVTGRLPDGGWQMALVPMDLVATQIDPSFWQPLGMQASVSYKVDFSGVRLGRDALIGGADDYHRQPWFSGGAIRFAAVQLGGAEALLDVAREALQSLGRTDDPYQRQRIGQGAILIESGRHWIDAAARNVDLGPGADAGDCDRRLAYANMTRTAIESICLEVMRIVERSIGVRGMLRPSPIERLLRDLTMYLRQPAPDAALAQAGAYVLDNDVPFGRLWPDGV